MARFLTVCGPLLFCLLVTGCGGDEGDPQRSESSRNCEDVCNFWAKCNSRELEPSVCANHCDEQSANVSNDCLDLYATQTDCEAENLDCSDRLGTACEAEYDAYYECESAQ
jgi:hypothetical protein